MSVAKQSLRAAAAALIAVTACGAVSILSAPAVAAEAPAAGHVANFKLTDQNGVAHELYKYADAKAVVLVTQMNGCPIVRIMSTGLKAVQDKYKGQGVPFMMLNSSLADNREDILAEAKDYGLDMPILKDADQKVGEQLNVQRTAEVIVINPKTWQITYRGPLDDKVTYERQRIQADHPWADEAIADTLAGKPVAVAQRQTEGCIINFPDRDAKRAKISQR